jgi:hypothetical protein
MVPIGSGEWGDGKRNKSRSKSKTRGIGIPQKGVMRQQGGRRPVNIG